MNKIIDLSDIRIDGGTQPREAIDQATVDDYAEAMTRLTKFPPLVVYHDGANVWLADGFHRYHAAAKIGATSIEVEWREGTLEMAKVCAAAANASHGKPRTGGDKKKAIRLYLSTSDGRRHKQRKGEHGSGYKAIATWCGVDEKLVRDVVAEDYNEAGSSDTPNAPKNASTAADEKRARIDAAIDENPDASDRAIARKTGTDPRTVGKRQKEKKKVHATAAEPVATPSAQAPPKRPADAKGGYSSATARDTAKAAKDAYRFARENLRDNDWDLFRSEIDELNAVRSRSS